MSAMGSVIMILLLSLLPAGLDHSRNLAIQCKLPEAQAAYAEFAQIRARPAATPAAVAVPAAQLRLLVLARRFQLQIPCDFGRCRHRFPFCSIAGTASPSAAAAPALRHRSGPSW